MDPNDETPALVLDAAEARVLGCLIEKEATTPDAYPLTVNAAQVAANQKTAREPVMALDPGAVNHALRQLEQKGLARQVFSSRAERYEHRADKALDLSRQQLALLGLLLLRGPQTVHELLSRGERLAAFNGADDVRHHLERLAQRQPALVLQIPRGAGQREDRYVHLLSGAVDVATVTARVASSSASSSGETTSPALEARLQALEDEVAELRQAVLALVAGQGGTG
ncbi:MAG: DUF480 domain-containing protein [Lysobacteraceae bacterium]|nr:MAG: DUF480 domain-containing protein [Xanthomonadaceae bacterium]